MDKKEAIEFLKTSLHEISNLVMLPYDNQGYPLWYKTIEGILEEVFGRDSSEYKEFSEARVYVSVYGHQQEEYREALKLRETAILVIINKHETLGIEEKPATVAGAPPKAFIAHGGDSPALRNLKNFLEALGVQPLVVEEQPSEGRSVGENVDWYARQADCAIILATKGDIDGKTGGFIPRGNVLMEIGKLQQIFKDRIIYLLQAGTKFPTNISEKVRERFTTQSMDRAFTAIARELTEMKILKAVKP